MSGTLSRPGQSMTVEVRVQHADGGYRTLEVVAANHIDEPSVGAIVVNARDVTERRRLEEQLRHAQKMEALGQLAGGVSHDFTNLLTAILGYCDLALSDAAANDPLRHDLEEIRSAGERATSLTRQLLAFARRQVLHPQIVDVNALVTQLDRLLRRLLSPHVELVSKLSPDVSRVKLDPASIEQILVNLAVYARDAMPLGGRVTIETSNVSADANHAATHAPMPAGPVRVDCGPGHERRSGCRRARAHLRTLRRAAQRGEEQRAWTGGRLRHGQTERRLHLGRERARRGNRIQCVFPAGGGRC